MNFHGITLKLSLFIVCLFLIILSNVKFLDILQTTCLAFMVCLLLAIRWSVNHYSPARRPVNIALVIEPAGRE